MKRHVQNAGTKKWFGDYLVELESEPLKAIDKMASAYDGCMITGGLLTLVSGTTYNVSAGLVSLKIDGEYKVAPLPATSNVDVSVQKAIRIVKTAVTGQYQIPVDLTIAYNYTAEVINYVAGLGTLNQDYLLIPTNGGAIRSYRDAIQSSLYRFVTDTEKNTWNSKAAGTHGHAATDITQTSSYRFVTDTEKATWNAKAPTSNPVFTGTVKIPHSSKIMGNATLAGGNVMSALYFRDSDDVSMGAIGKMNATESFNYIFGETGFGLKFATNGTLVPKMTITSAGNVGIGTDSPQQKIEINGSAIIGNTSAAEQTLYIRSLNNTWQVGSNNLGNGTDGNQFYIVDSAYRFTIQKGTGNVGIGTDSPAQKLDVAGVIKFGVTSTGILSYGTGFVTLETVTTNANIGIIPNGTGKVGICKNNPSEALDVAGNIKASGSIKPSLGITISGYMHGSYQAKDIYSALASVIPNTNDTLILSGGIKVAGSIGVVSYAKRTSSTAIVMYYVDGSSSGSITLNSTNVNSFDWSISW